MTAQTLHPDAVILSTKPRSLWRDAFYRLFRNRASLVGMGIILAFMLISVLAPLLAPKNPIKIHDGKGYLPPFWVAEGPNGQKGEAEFLLGTDTNGRDIFSRIIYGSRVSMMVGFLPTAIVLLLGVTIGLISGFYGGWMDYLLMRITDVMYAFPDLLFFIIVMMSLRDTFIGDFMNGLFLLFCALALVNWVGMARVVRGQVLSLKEKEYIEAARSIGAKNNRIMIRHILPNALGPVIILAALFVPNMIITEAILGYLGLGLRPATDISSYFITSWGAMLLDGKQAMDSQPWLLAFPAICVSLVVLAFTFLGDGLRDAFDPRLRGTQ